MSRKISLVVGLVMVFISTASIASAKTLLGKNYVGGSFGIFQFGDDVLDDVLGNGYSLGVTGNLNLNPNIDLQLGVAYTWADGEESGVEIDATSNSGAAELVYFFKPNEKINPYIGVGFGVAKSKIEISDSIVSVSADDTETGFGGKAGVELEFTDQVLFNFGLAYFNFDDDDSVDLNAGFGYWFNERVMGALSGSYDFDSEDALASVGLIFTL